MCCSVLVQPLRGTILLTLLSRRYAIDVQQDYENGSPTGEPGSSVTISGVTFEDITGTTTGDDAYKYYVLCGDGSCTDFTWTNIDITGGGEESCSPSGDICPS